MDVEEQLMAYLRNFFSKRNTVLAAAIRDIVDEMRKYWPLTVRQLFYRLVSAGIIPNTPNDYKRVSDVGAKLRRHHLVDWGAIEDRHRYTTDKLGTSDVEAYAKKQMKSFLNPGHYRRDYVQNQDNYVEVAVEKDALSSILKPVTDSFCTRLNVGKGQISATMVHNMAERFERAQSNGQNPVLLYLGDLDPSGIAIPKAIKSSLLEYHLIEIDLRRVGLNPEHIEQYDLPKNYEKPNPKDNNTKKFIEEFGTLAPTELDAMHPKDLQELISQALEDVLDMSAINEQIENEEEEREILKLARQGFVAFGREHYSDLFV